MQLKCKLILNPGKVILNKLNLTKMILIEIGLNLKNLT